MFGEKKRWFYNHTTTDPTQVARPFHKDPYLFTYLKCSHLRTLCLKILINRENEMKIDLPGAHASADKSAEIYKTK